ncbi:MAG: chitobiase/beta-hexosaminidase C-terminal domain-containing protein [Prevotella sp.]|nr:chitobiase/beta-hexosaminidase C-terminal domain-containing protein [Prevotella sp.]
MNRWFSICAFMLCQLFAFAHAGALGGESDDGGFNPNTPPNPDMPREKYTLTINMSPNNAGSINTEQSVVYMAGTKVYLEAYGKDGFVLEAWKENNEVISTERSFYYEMPEHDASLTAVFRFDPTTPPNPERPKVKHTMYLESQPVWAGYFNWNSITEVVEDQEIEVFAYNNDGYRFVEWQRDGQTVSKDYGYKFTMPHSDIHLVAIYEFNPNPPMNPGSNYFNPETGEVIIDDFRTGNLWEAIYQKINGDESSVKMLTVVGHTDNGDWQVARNFSQCTMFDFSRTTGMTAVPSWCFENVSSVESIILPASIESIGTNAFYNCSSLQTLTIHSVTPPTVSQSSFSGINSGLVVYVPALSVAQYQEAAVWRGFTIRPLQNEVSSLEVRLPKGTDISLYKDMYIELVNTASGQKQRYVVTNRLSYTFASLIHNTSYNVYLKNSKDVVLGQISGVNIDEDDVMVTFEELKVPRTVTLQVLTPDGEDVTEQTTITWTDADNVFISRGNTLQGLIEGTKLHYAVTLPQELGMQYLLPEGQTYEVTASNDINFTLTTIPQRTIGGQVNDLKTELPVAEATVVISQMLNGLYSKTYTTKTDQQGLWTLEVCDLQADITVSKAKYLSQSITVDTLTATIPTIQLKDINGTTLFLSIAYTNRYGETSNSYDDMANISFSVFNEQTGEQITELSIDYPQIVLMESLAEGSTVRVVATSKNGKFMPAEKTATIDDRDRASIEIAFAEFGGIQATFEQTQNTSVVGILYDESGLLIQSYAYAEGDLDIFGLRDGRYTLVSMGGSQFFNSIYALSQFSTSGLREGIDYVKNTVEVKSGNIAKITNHMVPFLDETKLYYTTKGTSVAVNKSQVTAGQFLTLTSRVAFKHNYADRITDVQLIVDLPESANFVAGSVMAGNSTTEYTAEDCRVIIPLADLSQRICFCFIPTAGGTFSTSASILFTIDGKTVTQPIGSATYTVENLSISVPSVVSNTRFPISGSAVGRSTVKIFVDGAQAGQTVALANGAWATQAEIEPSDTVTTHEVYAVVVTPDGVEMQSETQKVTYDPSAIQVAKVTMYYTNPEENWWRGKNYELVHDFQNPSVIAHKYIYYIFNRSFTFSIDFTTNDTVKVKDVVLEVKTGDGRWNTVRTMFDKRRGSWMAYGEFGNMYDGIVPVNVRVRFVRSTGTEATSDVATIIAYPGPDANVAIDPSGYVYEAVPSNRVQGATASIYYKETVEDEYGDLHENIVLWNAEEFAQQNPLFTDENGMYRWDVPQGLWQVKIEKEGYQTVYSEWLPVPPPQLDVNIAIKQLLQPNVKRAVVSEDGFEIEFDKYMNPESLTAENITLQRNGEIVEGIIELPNIEASEEGSSLQYASKVSFTVPADQKLVYTDNIQLTVSRKVTSYAGVPMEQDYTQTLAVEAKVQQIVADEMVNIAYGGERTISVAALPVEASKGKKLLVKSLSPIIAATTINEVTLDENGQAEITVSGELPGTTLLSFNVENTEVEGQVTINVKEADRLKTMAPQASRVSGTLVYNGTTVLLTSETENAVIYYTLDGSDPTDTEKALLYDTENPIVIDNDDTTIKAIAIGQDMAVSDVVTFVYSLRKSTLAYQLPKGWSWISHNLEQSLPVATFEKNAERIKDMSAEAVVEQGSGFAGSLSELKPAAGYKIKVLEATETRLYGNEFNATANQMTLETGWNWIGYPSTMPMTLNEALRYHAADEGDFIVGQDGFAEFVEGEWKGTLAELEPSKGYLYKAAQMGNIVFNTTSTTFTSNENTNQQENTPWTLDKHAYPNVMPLTAEVIQSGNHLSDSDNILVAAFCGNECRGIGKWLGNRLMMNICGEKDEGIQFVAFNTEDSNYYEFNERIAFVTENAGTWNSPYPLTIQSSTTTIEQAYGNDVEVTPTVFDNFIYISSANNVITQVTLANINGQTLITLNNAGKTAKLATSQLQEGVYVLTVQMGEQTFCKKLLKAKK